MVGIPWTFGTCVGGPRSRDGARRSSRLEHSTGSHGSATPIHAGGDRTRLCAGEARDEIVVSPMLSHLSLPGPLTDSETDAYNGAIGADGNALVLGSVASQQNPAIFVGVRQ
jgi:hypothetical protein